MYNMTYGDQEEEKELVELLAEKKLLLKDALETPQHQITFGRVSLIYTLTTTRAASAAELAVKKKVNKYAHLLDNYNFVLFAVETFGPWNHDAKVLVSQIGKILISITGDRRCTTYLRQRLSIAIQRGNAMSVLGTLPESSPLDEFFLL
ncbi:hypothetical protein ANN_00784 [Periplaneta americana]|uniref:Uncharacterized protein n=1 Tax=Periplaneta americana TaxID=6978 RepID=A0ABQ8TVS4_PERAM|nr:hypothetical protein ANN_00784 [Periplaneta americana]